MIADTHTEIYLIVIHVILDKVVRKQTTKHFEQCLTARRHFEYGTPRNVNSVTQLLCFTV